RKPEEHFMRRVSIASAVAGCLLLPLALSPAHAQADFYKGRTISVVIGAKTGSLALAAQIVAQHLGRYIPGNPTVIFRQMPGGAPTPMTCRCCSRNSPARRCGS